MDSPAIRVEGLGKRYRIPRAQKRPDTLRDAIAASARNALGAMGQVGRRRADRDADDETFWALQDVSFELDRGEVLGVIGANGAGKSTLLKLLSRITEPTTGRGEIRGRVGSLLEVGTGFHSELTGRENTYLSGAILGMRRDEIGRKFDEIVEFAEVGRFVDTPVKHYSSGMYLRLAFAVAAHLEPEILIVDEVLAVGDAAFQQKCLGKMGTVARDGRTVLFVSHNMNAIRSLCTRCLTLHKGRIHDNGDPVEVISRYLSAARQHSGPDQWIDLAESHREGTGEVRFIAAKYRGPDQGLGAHLLPDGPAEFLCLVESDVSRTVGSIAVSISSVEGDRLVNMDSVLQGKSVELEPGRNVVRIATESLHLHPGLYQVNLWMANPLGTRGAGSAFDYLQPAFDIEVADLRPSALGLKPNALVTCDFEVFGVEEPVPPASATARPSVYESAG